jgi:uncharacterized protein YciU (UPF0263 family)
MENSVFERVGNWYNVKVDGIIYEVLIQKEDDHTVLCDPSSIIVFDKTFKVVGDSELYDKIQKIMENVDWKYDVVEE